MMARASLAANAAARAALVVVIGATIGCDRVTKQMAEAALAGAPSRSFFADAVRLQYAENTGGFLSLGADLPAGARTALFTVATGLALLGLMALAVHLRRRSWSLVGLSFFIAGGASNWVDRVAVGHVVDFINVGIGPVRTGIFNVADVAIMFGCALLVLTEVRAGAETVNATLTEGPTGEATTDRREPGAGP